MCLGCARGRCSKQAAVHIASISVFWLLHISHHVEMLLAAISRLCLPVFLLGCGGWLHLRRLQAHVVPERSNEDAALVRRHQLVPQSTTRFLRSRKRGEFSADPPIGGGSHDSLSNPKKLPRDTDAVRAGAKAANGVPQPYFTYTTLRRVTRAIVTSL